jgi:Nucleotidyltransferase of unknown function (DUF6036)
MEPIDALQIRTFLAEVGKRYPQAAHLILLGGSALCLLGSSRPTLDIDYVGNDLRKNELQQLIDLVAQEMQIELEAVPIDEFVPVPADAQSRWLPVGRFGLIDVFIMDPYTMALSKLDRGFDTDIEDVRFLLHQKLITFEQLELVTATALEKAKEFAMVSANVRAHLEALRNLFIP